MRPILLHIPCLILFALSSASFAQGLPALPKAPEITVGQLPNGMSYYLVKNSATPGFADFALVQKSPSDVQTARKALTSLPHFPGRKPYRFLADNGIGYERAGFSHTLASGARVFLFNEVPVSSQMVSDSTLLMLFDIALTSEGRQAVVVSGDINVGAVTERMNMLSLMVPSCTQDDNGSVPAFVPSETLAVRTVRVQGAPVSTVRVSFRTPRTKKESLNTMLPIITATMASQLGTIVCDRVRLLFSSQGIPYSDVSFRYAGASSSDGDESLIFSVKASPGHVNEACTCLSSVLSDIDANGVSAGELKAAKDAHLAALLRDAGNVSKTNAEYLKKCISSYVYGTDLAPDTAVRDFYKDRKLDPEKDLELFNRYASALLDSDKNASLTVLSPEEVDPSDIETSFRRGWNSGLSTPVRADEADTLRLMTSKKKVKVKVSSSEPLSGGEMWTFSNGMKVVYKKTALKGKFHFNMMVKGGVTGVPGLKSGESCFVEDVIPLLKVAGISGADFSRMLRDNGISVSARVSPSDMRLSGCAPSSKATLLLKALLTFASSREVDTDAYDNYRSSEELRIRERKVTDKGLLEVLDSTMSPEYIYLDHKQIRNASDDLPSRVNDYLDHQFDNLGNGVIVLVGDLQKDAVQKLLCHSLGDLHAGSQRPVRPKSSYELRDCWLTVATPAEHSRFGERQKSVSVALSAKLPFDTQNPVAFKLAGTALEREMTKNLATAGYSADVTVRDDNDRLTVLVSCRPCQVDGLPSDVEPAYQTIVLNAIRSAVNRFTVKPLSDAELKTCKTILTNRMSALISDPGYLADAVATRNSEGKDEVTGYQSRVASVPLSLVRSILKALDAGTKVEYIIL